MSSHRWGDQTRAALATARDEDPVVIVPIGSTEQHGPHLPVDTDISTPTAIASAVAEHREDVLVTPGIPFGYSPHHRGVPGTITLRSSTVADLVHDVLFSIHEDGFERLLVLNGHGGNRAPLTTALSDLHDEHDIAAALISYWDLIADTTEAVRTSPTGGISHAGEMETSLQLYLREELVAEPPEDFIRDDRAGYIRTDLFEHGVAYIPGHFDDRTDTGVSGSPSAASAATGERLFEAAVEELETFVDNYRVW